ncbi:MAG: hypothetical protein U9M94_04460 [Patescibacteria group bacterium]|nr:hypothetical protein [Patescibacteria group bacterium]
MAKGNYKNKSPAKKSGEARKAKQKIFHLLLKEKNGGQKKIKNVMKKFLFWFIVAKRRQAEIHQQSCQFSRSVRFRSEPPRTRRVVSRGSVQKKLEFQPKGTANLQFQSFGGFLFLPAPAARSRSARKGLNLQRFATLRVAKKKCFGFGFGNSFGRCPKQNKVLQPIFFRFAFGETWKR